MASNLARSETLSNVRPLRPNWPVGGSVVGYANKAPAAHSVGGDAFALLDDAGTRISFGRNEVIFEEGDSAKHCFRLVSGSVRVCKLLADGRRQIVDFFLPGDFFGYADVDAYAFTAETVTNAVVMRYARTRVDMLSDGDFGLRRKLNGLLLEQLGAARAHLVILGRGTVKERISAFLIQMATRLGVDLDQGGEIDLPMGRLDVADYLGLTIETVCRAISELKRAGVISVPNTHRIVLRKIGTLRDLADGESLKRA